jgi:hypothetical protein
MNSKNLSRHASLAAVLVLGSAAGAEPAMRDVPTHDQLVEVQRSAAKESPVAKLKPSQGEDPSKVNKPTSIVADSHFLSFSGNATLVPKQAVLHVPANLADRMKLAPGCHITTFGSFYAVNRSWVETVEVSRIQAEGNQPLPEATLKSIAKSTKVVISTYKGGPITVLPLKAAASGTPAATTTPTVAKP